MKNIEKIKSYNNFFCCVNGVWIEPPFSQLVKNNNKLVDIIDSQQEKINELVEINDSLINAMRLLVKKQNSLENDVYMLCENQDCIKHETHNTYETINIPDISITEEEYEKFLEMLHRSLSEKEYKSFLFRI